MKVVFDFAGVMFDWSPAALIERVLAHRMAAAGDGARWAREFFRDFGGDWREFDCGMLEEEVLAGRIAARTGLTPDEARAVIDAVPGALQPNAGTVALLPRLKASGHRLFFLSNMPSSYADYLERTHDFIASFEDGIFSARVNSAKPDARIFELALDRFSAQAGECLFIDDHPANVETARSLGWQALHFHDAQRTAADLEALGLLAR